MQTCISVDVGRDLRSAGLWDLLADCERRWDLERGLIDVILVMHLHGSHFGSVLFFIV